MKPLLLSFIILMGIFPALPAYALQADEKYDEYVLENVDPVKAITLANQWRWSNKEIKSSVNSREVVFQFPRGKVKKIPLSEEKMLVALAPYVKGTHT